MHAKFLHSALFMLLAPTLAAQHAATQPDPLAAAIATAQDFPPAERVQFYVELIDKFKASRDPRLKEWIHTTLELARALPFNWTRAAIEKNAVTSLASIDAKGALESLILLAPTPNDESSRRPMDLRAFAATTVFMAAFQSGVSLTQLAEAGTALASEGDFPFAAIGKILSVADESRYRDEILLTAFRAASHYRDTPHADDVDTAYASFLKAVWPKLKPGERASILEPFLHRLEIVAANGNDDSLSKLVVSTAPVRLNQAQASRAMAGLNFLQGDFTQAQYERWTKLQATLSVSAVGKEPLSVVATNPKAEPSNQALAKATAKVQERGDFRWIEQNLDADAGLLFRRLSRISSLSLRYEAISSILPRLKPDSEEAIDLNSQRKKIENSELVLEVRLKILRLKVRMDRSCESPQSVDTIRIVLDLANQLFTSSYDQAIGRPAYDHLGFDEAIEIVEAVTACDKSKGLAAAQGLTHAVLRTYAIMSASAVARKTQ